ncbi:hypothetical protein [Psychromicrobium lacuslunae]|nr:hypothetical protein [Psychromicrobium lacuslunae]
MHSFSSAAARLMPRREERHEALPNYYSRAGRVVEIAEISAH